MEMSKEEYLELVATYRQHYLEASTRHEKAMVEGLAWTMESILADHFIMRGFGYDFLKDCGIPRA